jgi:predicted transcriptional regulator
MACINPDGTLTPTAQAVITALKTPCTPVDLAQVTGLPIYRIRSTIRELIEAGLVFESNGRYKLTESNKKRLLST